jgi:hypothetical protein
LRIEQQVRPGAEFVMGPIRGRLFGLCLPAALVAAADGSLTLAGQSAAYWAGDYARVNELSPTFHHLLAYHPLAFAAGFAAWVLVFTGLTLLLPQTLALTTSIAVAVGHTWGATTWLLYRFHYGYQACNGLFVLTAALLAVGIRWGWGAGPRFDRPVGAGAPLAARGGAAAALFGLAVYLFLWPRKP